MNDLRSGFAEHGFVRLAEVFKPEAAAAMADALWAELGRRHGITRDRSTWTLAEPRGLGALSRKGVFEAIATPAMTAAIDELLGQGGGPRQVRWGDPLVTFPSPGAWDVPAGGWHIDYPARGTPGAALLLKWLGYLAPVTQHGGGTVALAGSHRLVERFLRRGDPSDAGRSPAVRDAIFRSHPWLRGVLEQAEPGERVDRVLRLMERGASVDGVALRVIELTGRPGDVVFLHPHLFHAPAPNRSSWPRLMLTGGLTGSA